MPILLFTSKQAASLNIAAQLVTLGFKQIAEYKWQLGNVLLIDTRAQTVLDIPTNFDTDYLIVLSPHKGKEVKARLTVHVPGNWDSADFGGTPRTLNIAYGTKLTELIRMLYKHNASSKLGFDVVLEVDHHGPTCSVPIIFVEIGSSENEWRNVLAGRVVADSVLEAIKSDKCYETICFGVGGGHYAREFTDLILKEDVAIGHILPKYKIATLAPDTFEQAVVKNVERVDKVVALKTLNVAQKQKIKDLAADFNLQYTEL
jgi:D-aminoacyl-tRNA deacylase